MKLFKRFVSLKIKTDDKLYTINELNKNNSRYIKISFSVTKSNVKTPNSAKIEVYNLNKELRDILSKKNMKITLNAGYEDNHPILYDGDATNVWHELNGTNWVTHFVAAEGFVNIRDGKTNRSIKKGDSFIKVAKDLAKDMGLELEKNTDDFTLNSKEIMCGNSSDELDKICKSYNIQYHISDNKVKMFTKKLDRERAIVISSGSGLLKDKGVVKTEIGVDISSMLIPTILVGDTIYLDASYINEVKQNSLQTAKQDMTLESLNGYYKVTTATFSGDNDSGAYVTKLECINGH